MELFKITCVTCQAGLSVRNEALLGQIVACPRCGSMVEVAAPTLASDSGAAIAEPPAASQPPSSLATGSLSANSPATSSSATGALGIGASVPGLPALESSAGQPLEATSEVAAATEEAAPSVASHEAVQASAAVAKYQLIVWSLASFLIGAALVGVILFSRGDSGVEATALAPNNMKINDVEATVDPTPGVADLLSQNDTVADTPAVVEKRSAEFGGRGVLVEGAADGELLTPANDRSSVAAEPVNGPTKQPEPHDLEESLPEESLPDRLPAAAPAASPERAPRLARRLDPLAPNPLDWDPLDWDSESLTLETVDQPADVATTAFEPPVPESPAIHAEVSEEVPSTAPLVRRGPAGGPAGVGNASQRDADKQLALLIPAVKVDQLPLLDCLRLFSQLSGVPVSVAPEQLLMAGINPQKKVSLHVSEISLGEMLTQVLKPLRLEHEAHGPQVVVVRQEATKIREINYPIDDLLNSSTSAAELAGWVEQVVAPTTWQAAGGKGTLETSAGSLRITQTQQVQYQVLILLEQLRLARKLPPRSRYPVERLAGTPAHLMVSEKLSASTTFTFSQYAALDEIFVHWQTELGVPLLIDWPALAGAELWPDSRIACAIIDQPWGIALEKVLEPLGLGWRAATGGSIEITSAEKVLNEPQLRLYPLRRDLDRNGEAMLNQLRALARQQSAEVTSAILYDPAGKILLSYQPAAAQRLLQQQLQRD